MLPQHSFPFATSRGWWQVEVGDVAGADAGEQPGLHVGRGAGANQPGADGEAVREELIRVRVAHRVPHPLLTQAHPRRACPAAQARRAN